MASTNRSLENAFRFIRRIGNLLFAAFCSAAAAVLRRALVMAHSRSSAGPSNNAALGKGKIWCIKSKKS
jgi:hypothetical protein